MGHLTKAILREAEQRLVRKESSYICHAVAGVAGEPLGSRDRDHSPCRIEAENLLKKLGVTIDGAHFDRVGRTAGYDPIRVDDDGMSRDYDSEAYAEAGKAKQYGRILVIRIMQTMVPE